MELFLCYQNKFNFTDLMKVIGICSLTYRFNSAISLLFPGLISIEEWNSVVDRRAT